jgi:hypothetical protein
LSVTRELDEAIRRESASMRRPVAGPDATIN